MIPEVLAYASRETTMERRHRSAALIRSRLKGPAVAFDPEVLEVMEELDALAWELEDDNLALDPVCAVACTRLVSDLSESRLRDPAPWREDICSRVWKSGLASSPSARGPIKRMSGRIRRSPRRAYGDPDIRRCPRAVSSPRPTSVHVTQPGRRSTSDRGQPGRGESSKSRTAHPVPRRGGTCARLRACSARRARACWADPGLPSRG